MPLTILADDLTGACDTGALFTGPGPVTVAVAPARPGSGQEVAVLDTESRSLPPAAAARRVAEAWAALAPPHRAGRVFKKIDSSCRGQVGVEVEALLEAAGILGALICPAFPEQGRTVIDGVLHIRGEPVERSAVGRDPDFPLATSDVGRLIEAQASRPVRRLSLAEIRDPGELGRSLDRMGRALVVADAETDRDLARLADAVLNCSPAPLPVGSAGLARAFAARLGLAGPPVAPPRGSGWLIVAGSLHPTTHSQLRALEVAGIGGVRVSLNHDRPDAAIAAIAEAVGSGRPRFLAIEPPSGSPAPPERRLAAAALAQVVAAVLDKVTPDLLVLVGGETALAVYQALKADLLQVTGAPRSGLALGRLQGGSGDGVPILTKAGGFGPPDLFLSLLAESSA